MKKSHYIFIGNLNTYLDKCPEKRDKQLNRLLNQCESYFSIKLSPTHPKGSSTFMAFAQLNLALAYLLTKKEKYLLEAKRWMLCVCGYEKWGHAHLVNVDLSASWNLFGLSLAYDWLSQSLDYKTNNIVEDKIKLQAEVLYNYANENNTSGWVIQYLQNHNWINFTGLAAAGYVLNNSNYIQMAKDNFDIVYPLLSEDGSDYEGVVYWRYGAMWLFMYAYLLKSEENIDKFSEVKFLENTIYYRIYQSAPDLSRQLNFGDTHDTHSGHPACIYRLVAKEYNNSFAQYLASYVINNLLEEEAKMSKVKPGIMPEAFLEYLFFDPTISEKNINNLPLFKYFPDLGLITSRSSWEKDAKVFSFKCGYPGGKKQWLTLGKMKEKTGYEYRGLSHNHPDHLSYLIINGENYLTAEDGYNRNIMEYHHSSLLVDDKLCDVHNVNDVYLSSFNKRIQDNNYNNIHLENENYKAEIKNINYKNNFLKFESDAHKLYPYKLKLKKVGRKVFTDNKTFIAFINVFDSEIPHKYSCICNTNEKAIAVKNDTNILNALKYRYEKTNINYYTFALDNNILSSTKTSFEVKSVMTTQEPDKVCTVNIQSLKHETINKETKFYMVEIFTFDNSSSIKFINNELIVSNHTLYKKNN